MTHRVVFKTRALADLQDIYRYIRDRELSVERAETYVARIRRYCESFSLFPERGMRRDDLRKGRRTVGFERRVLIVFDVETDVVYIGRVFYGGRDYETILRSLPRKK